MKVFFPDWRAERWVDLKENPLIKPPGEIVPGSVIGDPQVILPGEYDEYWHMFAWSKGKIYHLKSQDGIHWRYLEALPFKGGLSYIYRENDVWYLFYTKYGANSYTEICLRESVDLMSWSREHVLLKPELSWENEGRCKQVRNPCLIKIDNIYRFYYSGGTIWLEDCGYEEPKYISFAEAEDIYGPYKRHGKPILKPNPSIPYRNFGAGALKVYKWRGEYIGFNNGIYKDRYGRSRSATCLLASLDGIEWIDAPYNPIMKPGRGWKKALVYQLDAKFIENEKILLYYNARNGWREGIECIGCSILEMKERYK